jgi:hypothetical protein
MEELKVKELENFLKDLMKDCTPLGEVSPGCFHIGHGAYTGVKGWEMFNELLKEEAKNFYRWKR